MKKECLKTLLEDGQRWAWLDVRWQWVSDRGAMQRLELFVNRSFRYGGARPCSTQNDDDDDIVILTMLLMLMFRVFGRQRGIQASQTTQRSWRCGGCYILMRLESLWPSHWRCIRPRPSPVSTSLIRRLPTSPPAKSLNSRSAEPPRHFLLLLSTGFYCGS